MDEPVTESLMDMWPFLNSGDNSVHEEELVRGAIIKDGPIRPFQVHEGVKYNLQPLLEKSFCKQCVTAEIVSNVYVFHLKLASDYLLLIKEHSVLENGQANAAF